VPLKGDFQFLSEILEKTEKTFCPKSERVVLRKIVIVDFVGGRSEKKMYLKILGQRKGMMEERRQKFLRNFHPQLTFLLPINQVFV